MTMRENAAASLEAFEALERLEAMQSHLKVFQAIGSVLGVF